MSPGDFEHLIADIRDRNQKIESLFNDGWRIHAQIVCPPNVMLISGREKQSGLGPEAGESEKKE